MKRLFRPIGVTSVVAACALVFAAGATAKPGLDRSYGQNGVDAIVPVAPAGFRYPVIEEMASARDGSVYALVRAQAQSCSSYCPSQYLERIGSTGAIDTTFNRGVPVALPLAEAGYRIAVDTEGRVLAGGLGGGSVQLHRYELGGALETSFGVDGTATVNCGCEPASVQIAPARRERILVVGSSTGEARRSTGGGRFSLARLLPDGTHDPDFGVDGAIGYPLRAANPPTALAVTTRGAILLGSENCCAAALDSVLRVSAAGNLDTRFDRTAASSLRRLNGLGEVRSLASLVPRANGTLDLLGGHGASAGFDLRLRANGRLAAGFGRKGLMALALPVASAALGTGGAIFAADRSSTAFRILTNGKLDPGFGGAKGVASGLTGSPVEVGVQAGGRAVVMNAGHLECRSGCEPTPGIARFIEGAKQ
jgi:uncharacterized delta-60 repeat protein